ncbi:unnamed protein product, partial [marine sediment metagenome]
IEDILLDKMLAMGIISLADLSEVGAEPLVNELGMDEGLAAKVVETAGVESQRIAVEMEAAKKAAKLAAEQDARAAAEGGLESEAVESEPGVPSSADNAVGDAAAVATAAPQDDPVEGDAAASGLMENEESQQTTEQGLAVDEPTMEAGAVEAGDPT